MTAASLPGPDVTRRRFWTSDRVTEALAPTLATAAAERGSPWPQLLASQYARFFRDGDRTAYESRVAARQARLTRATLAALLDPRDDQVDEVVDGVLLLCEQSTWSWAAHDDAYERLGRVTPAVTEPYLDLGAGEVAAQLAWVDHLLGPVLDERAPGTRERVRHETRARVLRPFTERRDWWWLGVGQPLMNWSPWIQGNVLAANLALEEDPVRRWATTELVADGIAAYWASLPADGGVDEGYHYWWQGAARALEAQDLLAFAGVDPAPQALERIRATVAFPHSMHLGGDWYVNVADGPARPPATWPWNVVHAWAVRTGDTAAAQHAASYRGRAGGLFDERASLARAVGLLAASWGEAPAAEPPLVGHATFPATGVAVARSAPGSTRGVAVTLKGGHNEENHNHVDVGSVVVALDGVPLVVDAGKPTYRAGTFGPDRYDLWTLRGDWHNVPRVRGVEQPPGADFAAREFAVTAPGDGRDPWHARVDLAGAYPVPGLEHWWRDVELDVAAESVVVEDSWSFAPDDAATPVGPTTWHWLLAGDVTLTPGEARARFVPDEDRTRPPRTLSLVWDPDMVHAALDLRELDDPELVAVWGRRLTRLRLTARAEPPSGTFSVTMRPTPRPARRTTPRPAGRTDRTTDRTTDEAGRRRTEPRPQEVA